MARRTDSTAPADRSARRRADRIDERRRALADAALLTLSELGYARTSLREIAQNSAFSHGVLHYYFRDKVDLITYCVRQYKTHCVERYDGIVATAASPEDLLDGVAEGLAATLEQDALLHRLWYDLRTQSLFEESFRADVAAIDGSLERMIWRTVEAYARLVGAAPACPPSFAYATVDGLFHQALQRHLAGAADALDVLRAGVRRQLATLVA
ncbi:TetR family transcriptional regulator [Actinomycetospora sp. NBRC 106375]|uniref:TetR/AcrR family transcriptional regulator n=1 Tax=Actinomycetospora sp. NBRC 106375 TaxID=3032207 RepID=UPI0024A46191|nr:TetR/AcrR family transcriptional regulator [Actinomycetospora sp. NBRC 106375]GLZ47052.1 TetR family transcriptional regulator [Actinomycetospora sp. NBRC 106375]